MLRLSRRAVNDWNALPDYVVLAPSVPTFETRLDDHFLNALGDETYSTGRGFPLPYEDRRQL